ncbi:MAG: LacI family DNA-binding transcriptional regulator [Lentisphaeria bacterium]|nr:LacI family DNA-binding transcriptional regulator [Lentisphaeria bacterium]
MAGISLGDIAKSLSLSRVTVSMVMNDKAEKWRISDATRRRVLAEAARLGYRRNAHAHAMITGKTRVIGFLERELATGPSACTLQGVAEAAIGAGYSVKPFVYSGEEEFGKVLASCMEHRPAALMYRMVSHRELGLLKQEAHNFGIPFLVHGSAWPMESGLRVNTDDVRGGRIAVEHLIGLGHRRIAFVGTPGRGMEFADSRCRGFREAMKAAGLEGTAQLIEAGVADIETLLTPRLKAAGRPTALFCMSDQLAMKALHISRECGVSVPEELSVVGYADLEMARYGCPPLTTVAEPFREVGHAAFRLMRGEIESESPVSFGRELSALVDVRLAVRESTAAVPC